MNNFFACILMAVTLLAGTLTAAAEQFDVLEQKEQPGSSALTEVYGYTAQEAAEQFTFEVESLAGGDVYVQMYPKAHPSWVYTYTETSSGGIQTTSPFHTGYADYPGENVVRDTLRMALEEGWFYTWQWDDRGLLRQRMIEWNMPLTEALNTGLEQGTLSPIEAVTEYFRSCYGPDEGWSKALIQWHDEIQQLVLKNYQGNG